MKIKTRIPAFVIAIIVGIVVPAIAIAQTISGPNYQLENSTFDGGGEAGSSANYSATESVGGIETGDSGSTNYKNPSGFQPGAYPGIPGQPTLINTGGVLYNSLDFIVATGSGQQTDTVYAIAISADDFTTTEYIQTDNTVGASQAWQSYADWGAGTGERVTGLLSNTTYKIKVKASYGAGNDAEDSESGFSLEASAATTSQSLLVSINGSSSGTAVAGVTTTVNSTSGSMGFGSLTIGDGFPNIAAQTITVTTNATGGYTSTVQQDGDLRTNQNDTIPTVPGSNASPAAFGTGVSTGRFGYHTTDSSLCTGSPSRFSTDDTYAAVSTTPFEVACSTGPVISELTTIVYKLVIGSLQESGQYQNIITYITTATY